MNDSDYLVTVAKFVDMMSGRVAKLELDAHGIESILLDDNFSLFRPIFLVIDGGVRLQTRGLDAREAREILNRLDEKTSSDPAVGQKDSPQAVCPDCGSSDVAKHGAGFRFLQEILHVGSRLILMTMPPDPRKWKTSHRCNACGRHFGSPYSKGSASQQ